MVNADNLPLAVHIEAAECNTGKCVEVLAAAGCIVLAIAGRNVPALLACVGGATDKVTIKDRNLHKWHIRLIRA